MGGGEKKMTLAVNALDSCHLINYSLFEDRD